MSTKHIRSMGDFMRFDMDIEIECKCGRIEVLPWFPVMVKFHHKRWSDNLESAKMRFRCLRCGKHPSHIGPHERS